MTLFFESTPTFIFVFLFFFLDTEITKKTQRDTKCYLNCMNRLFFIVY